MMPNYFVQTNSFAAPLMSDTDSQYVDAASPEAALEIAAREYRHPCGLYAAVCYASADAMNKGDPPLARWLCNQKIAKLARTKDLHGYAYYSNGPGRFTIDGNPVKVANPKFGRVVA